MRTAGAVVAGYAVMALIVFVSFSLAFLALGAERTFQPGSYAVTTTWVVVSFVLGFVAAVAGGLVCGLIARADTAPRVLAALVIVLGLAMAVPAVTSPPAPPTRGPAVSNTEAMMNAREPLWMALANPFLGAFGVLLGAHLRNEPSTP